MISEPIGALVAIFTIIGVNKLVGTKDRKDNVIGYVITAIGLIAMLAFTLFFALDQYSILKFPLLTDANSKIAFGAIAVLVALVGLYFIPKTLATYKAAIVALLATLASGISFIIVAALVIFAVPGILFTTKAPPVDVFVLSALPIVIGCAIINMVLAQILYFPAKKAMR